MASEGLTFTPTHLPHPGPASASDCVTLVSGIAASVLSCTPPVVFTSASRRLPVIPAATSGGTPSATQVRN